MCSAKLPALRNFLPPHACPLSLVTLPHPHSFPSPPECRAVRAARKAFDEGPWPRMTGQQRGKILARFADLIDQHTEELAALESLVGWVAWVGAWWVVIGG